MLSCPGIVRSGHNICWSLRLLGSRQRLRRTHSPFPPALCPRAFSAGSLTLRDKRDSVSSGDIYTGDQREDKREPVEQVLQRILEPRLPLPPSHRPPQQHHDDKLQQSQQKRQGYEEPTNGQTRSHDTTVSSRVTTNPIGSASTLSRFRDLDTPALPLILRPTAASTSASFSATTSRPQLPSEIASEWARSLEKSRQSLEAQLRDLRAKLSDIFAIAKSESDDIPTRASRVVNYVTGYDRIQELRLVVDAAGSSFTAARGAADRTKRRYEQSVIDRANCQREINLLLQRKHLWTDSDVLNFTSLYKAEHQHEQAEIQAKEAVDAAEQDVNRKYDQLVDAIRERYHEEQLWSDKIRLVSSYATWAVLCLNILMIIVVQAYFEPKKRQKIVDGVEERLGARISSQMQDTSGTSLDRDWTKGITRSISEVSDKLATVLLALQQLVHNQAIYQQQQQQQQQSQPVESKVTSDNEKLLMLFQESLQEALRPYPLDGIGAADSTAASVIPPRLPSFSRKVTQTLAPQGLPHIDDSAFHLIDGTVAGIGLGAAIAWLALSHR